MTKKLSECSYCKRPADEDGSIFHVGGCTALQEVPLNRLQYDGLTQEIERLQKREAQFAAALYAVKEVVAKDSPQWLLADQLARMMLSAPPSEPSEVRPSVKLEDYGPVIEEVAPVSKKAWDALKSGEQRIAVETPQSRSLFDMADNLIREMRKHDMWGMRSEYDNWTLRITRNEPAQPKAGEQT